MGFLIQSSVFSVILRLMISVHFLHVHIGMLHGVLLTGRRTVFFELPSFIDFQPVVWVKLFESSYEDFLISICSYRFKYGGNLVFLTGNKTAHCEYPSHMPTLYDYLSHAQSMPYFLSTHLIDAQPIWLFSIYIPDACGADMYLRCPVTLCRYGIFLMSIDLTVSVMPSRRSSDITENTDE